MSQKALIVYGSRFGATTGTAAEIADVLDKKGVEVKLVNARKEKVKDISGYDLIIVGSGMMMHRWTGGPEKFLNRFQKELASKKLALFVSSGAQALIEFEKKVENFQFGGQTTALYGEEATGRAKKVYLEEKAAKYGLKPISSAVFGGIWDLNHMPWWTFKAMASAKPKLEAAGFREKEPGVYDTRDWNDIRSWALGLYDNL